MGVTAVRKQYYYYTVIYSCGRIVRDSVVNKCMDYQSLIECLIVLKIQI